MTQVNNTATMLGKLNDRFKKANPNQGQGSLGKWPNEPNSSELEVVITGITIKRDGQMSYGKTRASKKHVPALEFQSTYRWDGAPDGNPMTFKGENITVPYDIDSLPENDKEGKQRTRAEIATDRLCGQLTGLIGSQPDDIDAALNHVEEMFKTLTGGKEFVAQVKLDIFVEPATGTSRGRTNKTDYIQSVLNS